MKTRSLLYFIFASTLLLYSCKGDDGAPGPRGPQGVPGQNGQDGEDGQDGTDTGSPAKTVQFEILTTNWTSFGTQGQQGYGYGVQLNVPDITQSVYDYGAIITFMRFGTNSVWESIPQSYSQDLFDQYWNVFHDVSSVWVEIYDNDFQTTAPTETVYLKVVVIDGVAGAKYSKPNIDLTNYTAVKTYYGLED